jgi:hypothetical protein
MSQTQIEIAASPEEIFGYLEDCRTYESWLVGCKEIRSVEPEWPAPGARFFHRVGVGPLTIADCTKVISIDLSRELVLEARARPAGVAHVRFTLEQQGTFTVVAINEMPKRGFAAAAWNPAFEVLVHLRNKESLRRLKNYVEERSRKAA